MENKFEVNSAKAITVLSINVILFFSSIILGLIVFDNRHLLVKIGFLVFALILVGFSFISYRIVSGAYYLSLINQNLVLSKTLNKIVIPLTSIEKLDIVKGKGLLAGDDYIKIEYKNGKNIEKTSFLLYYMKEDGDKIYSQIISHLEKVS